MGMKKGLLGSIIFLAMLTISCSKLPRYEKLADGIIVRLADGQTRAVKLRVISDEIIQVVATAVDTFSTSISLIVLPEVTGSPNWKFEESDKEVVLTTAKLKAHVLLASGKVKAPSFPGEVFSGVSVDQSSDCTYGVITKPYGVNT